MKRKILSLMLLGLMVGGLASCGSSNSSSGNKKIVIWNAGFIDVDDTGTVAKADLPFNKAVAEWEKENPGYTVQVNDYSEDDVEKAFTAANLSKSGPDIVALWAGSPTQAYSDYCVDFNSVLTADQKKFYDVGAILHKDNDPSQALIGLPSGLPSSIVMFYNKKIFADNNLQVPTNYDELIAVSKTLKAKGITPLELGDKDGYMSTWGVSPLIANLLGPQDIANLAPGGSEKLSGNNFEESLKTWKDYVGAGYTNPDYLTLDNGTARTNFINGQSAMIFDGGGVSSDLEAMGDNIGVAKVPAISKDAKYADYMISQPNINVVVTNYSKEQDKAVDLAEYLTTADYNEKQSASIYAGKVTGPLQKSMDELVAQGKNVTGFDSIITGDAASEYYSLVPTYVNGTLKLDDFTKKLDDSNVTKK